MDQNLPEQLDEATERLRLRLLDGAPDDISGAAVTLLCDIPGAIYATEPFRRKYITDTGSGKLVVNWSQLGFDLQAGDDELAADASARALLMLAASIGAEHGVRISLGALLPHLDPKGLNLVIGALQHAGGVW